MEPKTFDCALSISPLGWKKTDKDRVLEIGETADNYYEYRGWQLWFWEDLSDELRAALIHAVADVHKDDYRFVQVETVKRDGESEGDQSGPFDLMLCERPNFPEDWVHYDPDYPSLFFEFYDKRTEP